MYSQTNEIESDKLILDNLIFSARDLFTALARQGIPISIDGNNLHLGKQILQGPKYERTHNSNGFCPLMGQMQELINRISEIERNNLKPKLEDPPTNVFNVNHTPNQPQRVSNNFNDTRQTSNDPFKIAFAPPVKEKKPQSSNFSPLIGENRTCSTCGANIAPRAIFCAKCGSNVRS